MSENIKKTGNILLTTLLVLFGLNGVLIYFSPSLNPTEGRSFCWVLYTFPHL
ncbi:MAG: hypothetical protein ACOX6L_10135 [Syntrophomonadaceae bacterium]|jgi:hypothetical protein